MIDLVKRNGKNYNFKFILFKTVEYSETRFKSSDLPLFDFIFSSRKKLKTINNQIWNIILNILTMQKQRLHNINSIFIFAFFRVY